MTVLNKEMKENNRVELTIRVEKPEWRKALDDAYQPTGTCTPWTAAPPARPPVRLWSRPTPRTCSIQGGGDETFPRAWWSLRPGGDPGGRSAGAAHRGHRAGGFTFAALAELYPEVKLGKYKGLAAPMPQAELSNDDVTRPKASGSRPTWWRRSGTGPPWATR